jgi:hypothetical protein
MKLVTDLILADHDELFVLDAKDYAADSYPETADITKQILYRVLHSDRFDPSARPLERTHSAFLFPALVDTPSSVRVRCVHLLDGHADAPADRAGWGDIVCIDLDYERVARAFARGPDTGLRGAVLAAIRSVKREVARA